VRFLIRTLQRLAIFGLGVLSVWLIAAPDEPSLVEYLRLGTLGKNPGGIMFAETSWRRHRRGAPKRPGLVRCALNQSHLDMPPTRSPQWPVAMARAGLIALLPLLGLGCEDAAEPEVTATPAPQKAESPALPRIKWLDSNDGITPERWLASGAAHAGRAWH